MPEQQLLIPNPGVDVRLPGSDLDWDNGVRSYSICLNLLMII